MVMVSAFLFLLLIDATSADQTTADRLLSNTGTVERAQRSTYSPLGDAARRVSRGLEEREEDEYEFEERKYEYDLEEGEGMGIPHDGDTPTSPSVPPASPPLAPPACLEALAFEYEYCEDLQGLETVTLQECLTFSILSLLSGIQTGKGCPMNLSCCPSQRRELESHADALNKNAYRWSAAVLDGHRAPSKWLLLNDALPPSLPLKPALNSRF